MEKSKTRSIAVLGIMTAVLIVVFALETLIGAFFITPPAVLSLTVLFVLCFSYDVTVGFLSGVIFGLSSLIIAWAIGNPLFILPWISVLPRLLVGIGAYGVKSLTAKLTENSQKRFLKDTLPYSLGAGTGIIINTLSVLLCLTFFAPEGYGNTFIGWMKLLITVNFPIELVCAVVLTPILIKPVKRYLLKDSEKSI